MKKILQILSVFLLSCLAVVLFGTVNQQKAFAVDALTGQCHWKDSGHIYCGENVQAVDYYFNSAATKSYGQNQYAVFLDGKDSNPVLFVDMKGDGKSAFLTDKVESIPNGAQNGLIDNSNYNNVPADNSCSIHSPTNCDEHLDEPFKSDSRFNARWGGDLPFPADVQAKFVNQTLASAASADQGCEKLIDNPLSFFLCPLGNAMAKTLDGITNFILDQLNIKALPTQDSAAGGGISGGLTNFRNVANSLYVLIFLFIILANFIAIPGLDNYTIKKLLPRLITCVIITQFAYLVCTLAIDLSNVLLNTVPSLVTGNTDCLTKASGSVLECSSIGGAQKDIFYSMINGNALQDTSLKTAVGTLQGALAGIGFFILTLILIVIALIVLIIALAYIAFRNVALIILVFISPLAIAAWVLPNTETYAKKWASWFVKLLIMGPIVGLILASSVLVSKVLAGSGNAFMQFLAPFIAIFAFILIPKSFKWSGDLMHATGKMIADSKVGKAGKESFEKGKAGEYTGKAVSAIGGKVPGFGTAATKYGAKKQAAYKAAQKENFGAFGTDDLVKLSTAKGANGDNARRALASKRSELAYELSRNANNGIAPSLAQLKDLRKMNEALGNTELGDKAQPAILPNIPAGTTLPPDPDNQGWQDTVTILPNTQSPNSQTNPPATNPAAPSRAGGGGGGSTNGGGNAGNTNTGQPGTPTANPNTTRTRPPSTTGWQQRPSGLFTPPNSSGNSGGNGGSTNIPPLTGPNGQPFTPPAPSGPTSQVPPPRNGNNP